MHAKTSNKTVCRLTAASFLFVLAFFASGCAKSPSRQVDLVSELDVLTNISKLAEVPFGSAGMVTSFDRTGGNNDGWNVTATAADGNPLVADLKGPGCVKRLWFTGMPPETKFYFFFDDEPNPRFTWTFDDIAKGKAGTVLVNPVCGYPSGAICSYWPIPYSKRLIISSDKIKPGRALFFHVNHVSYKRGTKVESLGASPTASQAAAARLVAEKWLNGFTPEQDGQWQISDLLGRGEAVINETGPGVIDKLAFKPEFPTDMPVVERNAMLRALSLRIYWDGSAKPGVDVPFGDFFCNGQRVRQFHSMPISVADGQFVSKFPMPFNKTARIVIENNSQRPMKISYKISKTAKPSVKDIRYLHASWRYSISPGKPHEILRVAGKGHYVGCYLIHIGMEGSWNIFEGDECIYRDGEDKPSMHGTGLEDYFDGGWYYNFGVFNLPLSGCLEKSAIKASQYRFHVPDPVEYSNGLLINIEFGHGNTSRGYMSSVAYWYSDEPGGIPYEMPQVEKRFLPMDPIERTAFMNDIFEREKTRRADELIDLCAEYAQRYPGSEESQLFKLRALAYKADLKGISSVEGELSEMIADPQYESVRKQASLIKQLYSSGDNCILTAHINGAFKLYLDGRKILEGDSPVEAVAELITLPKGKHTIAAEVEYRRIDPWVSIAAITPKLLDSVTPQGMEGAGTMTRKVIRTDGTWKIAKTAGEGWHNPGYDDSSWTNGTAGGPFPWMRYFQFKPNAFIFSQCYRQLVYFEAGWPEGQKMYIRKDFELYD